MKLAKWVICVVPTISLMGCSATTGEQSSVEGTENVHEALATLDLPAGQRVSFHEFEGSLIVNETGPIGVPSVLETQGLREAGALEIFEALAPHEAVPEKLQAAVERLRLNPPARKDALAPLAPARIGEQPSIESGSLGDVAVTRQAVTASAFISGGGCNIPVSNPVFSDCRTDWWNGYYAYAWSQRSNYNIASASGSFTARFTINGGSPWDVAVGDNKWIVHQSVWAGSGTVQHRVDILNASGDSFHVGDYWWNQ